MKTSIKCALILAVALVLTGSILSYGIVKFKSMDRTVSVRGLCERDVQANKVTWPLTYKEIGNDPQQIYESIAAKNQAIIAFLKSGGVTDAEINVGSPMVSDRQADNYSNEILNYRYVAKGVITVVSTDIEKVRKLLLRQSELMRQGIALVSSEYDEHGVTYEFTDLNKIKPEMVEEATKNARATAQKFADDSGSSIGSVTSAQQGQFTIEDCDATTPYIKHVRVVTTLSYALD